MDPNELISEMRQLAQAPVWKMSDADVAAVYGELAEKFVALDEWLSSEGFLPSDWRR